MIAEVWWSVLQSHYDSQTLTSFIYNLLKLHQAKEASALLCYAFVECKLQSTIIMHLLSVGTGSNALPTANC